jgi:2-polyprenyl-3-methyl-5-hydroxy-6-metoxy-1,4-benzoquinol methylase
VWNERFSEPGFAYGSDPNDFLVEVIDRLPRGRALCLGEGEGRNAVYLAQQGFEVTAVDLSSVGLEKAQRLAESRGVRLQTVVADLQHYTIDLEGYDVIVSIWCHLPSALRHSVYRQVVAGLKRGGCFVLESYTPAQLAFATGGPRDVDMLMTAELLRAELAGLSFERLEEKERDIFEGKYHNGRSAVVQLLASKPMD